MPKTGKTKSLLRHDPLLSDIKDSEGRLKRTKLRAGLGELDGKKVVKAAEVSDEDEESGALDAVASQRILKLARRQQDEIQEEDQLSKINQRPNPLSRPRINGTRRTQGDSDASSDEGFSDVEDEDDSDDELYEDYDSDFGDDMAEFGDLGPEEAELLEKFIAKSNGGGQVTLADKIMEKINAQQAESSVLVDSMNREAPQSDAVLLPAKVVEVYTQVGELLSRYRSGKLPKAFKIIPSLKNWEDVLMVTNPEQWSPNACYEATKLMVSALKSYEARKFVEQILLERFRDDIAQNKKLNYHLYRSLKKSLYKPAAFFKGFLFPLCETGRCTVREAVIVGSVLQKVSIPSLHSSAALLRLAEMNYSGTNSLFIKVLLDKKYALPFKVIDGVVFHFLLFRNYKKQLPVIWHQSLLVFAQRYKNDVTADQKEALLELLKLHPHPSITPEIRREFFAGVTRDGDVAMS